MIQQGLRGLVGLVWLRTACIGSLFNARISLLRFERSQLSGCRSTFMRAGGITGSFSARQLAFQNSSLPVKPAKSLLRFVGEIVGVTGRRDPNDRKVRNVGQKH